MNLNRSDGAGSELESTLVKKTLGTLVAVFVTIVAWLAFSGKLPYWTSSDSYINLSINGEDRIVVAYELKPAWQFSNRLSKNPEKIEPWRKLILISQSDFLKYINNKDARRMYGRARLTDEMIDTLRTYVINRSKDTSSDLKISKVYIVLDRLARLCHLLVPLDGPQGRYYKSLECINGEWNLVPETSGISWVALNGKKIVESIESKQVEYEPAANLDREMRKISAVYLTSK